MATKPDNQDLSSTERNYENFIVLEVTGITDYADFDSLWNRNPGGPLGYLGINRPKGCMLFAALGHRALVDIGVTPPPVFTSVIYRIPVNSYRALTKTQKEHVVINGFVDRHERDFKGKLLRNRKPTYLIVPDDTLPPGMAQFIFGQSVFVPNSEDNRIFSLEFALDTPEPKFQPLQWKHSGMIDPIPAGLYENQHGGLNFGPETSPCRVDCVGLHSSVDIIPGTDGIETFSVLYGENAEVVVDLRGKNTWECLVSDPAESDDHEDVGITPSIRLRILRVEPIASETQDDNLASQEPLTPDEGLTPEKPERVYTYIPGEEAKKEPASVSACTYRRTCQNLKSFRIEGFLLPRIDAIPMTTYPEGVKVTSWALWFDKHGNPYLDEKENPALSLKANNREPVLYFKEEDENSFRSMASDKCDYQGTFTLLPPPKSMEQENLAVLVMPYQGTSVPLEEKNSYICGRSPDSDLALNKLDVKNCMTLENGKNASNWDLLGTSSRHARVELVAQGGLKVTQLSGTNSIYILDKDNVMLEELPRVNTQGEEGRSSVLSSGQKVAIGRYLLRFDGNMPRVVTPNPNQEKQRQAGDVGEFMPVHDKVNQLLGLYLQARGETDFASNDIGALTYKIKGMGKTFLAREKNHPIWAPVWNACESMRLARNSWVHHLNEENRNDILMQNLFSYKSALNIMKQKLFENDFVVANSQLIAEIEQLIATLEKAQITKMAEQA